VLENPGVGDQFDDITSMMERVVVEYGGEDPDLSVTHLEMETDFQGIVEHFREPIAQIQTDGGTAAVDVTPVESSCRRSRSKRGFSSRPTTSSISMYRTTASTADCTPMSPDQLSNSLTSRGLLMQLARHHITHLLNALYTEGITSVSVRHPCEEIGELLEIDLSDPVATTVRFTQGALTYQDSREELHTTYDEQAYDDLPDKDTYIRALVAGGLVDIENREDVETFFRRQGYPDLDAGHQPVALGIDTNLLAWRMPDVLRLDPERYSDDKGRSPVNGFALATGIYEELNWHYNHYETREPSRMRSDPSSLGWTISRLGRNREGVPRALRVPPSPRSSVCGYDRE